MKVKQILENCSKWYPSRSQTTPMVSIFLPTYRRAKSGLFARAVQSVINQNFKAWELIIVDDASTDGTEEIIKYYMELDERIGCIRHAFNVGIPAISEYEAYMKSKGEYIAFIFDDCQWERSFLSQTICYMQMKEAKATYGVVKAYTDDNNYVELGKTTGAIGLHAIDALNYIANSSIVLHREVVERVGLYDPHITMTRLCDWDLLRRIHRVYRLEETGILNGVERGITQNDSLGNTYYLDKWLTEERTAADRSTCLLPQNFAEIDIFQTDEHSTELFRKGVAVNANRTLGGKKWYAPVVETNAEEQPRKRVLVICPGFTASYALSFERMQRENAAIIFHCLMAPSMYDLLLADAVIIIRDGAILNRYVAVCAQIGIPCYLYLDDNFLALAPKTQDTVIKREAKYLSSAQMKNYRGVIASTPHLKEYFETKGTIQNVYYLPPIVILPEQLREIKEIDQSVTVSFLGGSFRNSTFQEIVLPALARQAKKRKVRVICSEGVQCEAFEGMRNLEIIKLKYEFSLDAILRKVMEYHPDIFIHCGREIENNLYKTENALYNATFLGCPLLVSNILPYSEHPDGRFMLVENTVEDWAQALDRLIENRNERARLYEKAREYCVQNHNPQTVTRRFEEILADVKPAQIGTIMRRVNMVMNTMPCPEVNGGGIGQVKPSRSRVNEKLGFTGEIAKSRTYTIKCGVDNFSELGICFASYGEPEGYVHVEIHQKQAKLREAILALDEFIRDDWTYVSFDPIPDSKDQIFKIKLIFDYRKGSYGVGVFEDASKITKVHRIKRKLGLMKDEKLLDLLFVDCRN